MDLKTAAAGKGQQHDRVDTLLLRFRQAVVGGRQNICTKRIAHQYKALGAPFLPVVLHQLGEVGGALLGGLVLPVVAQHVDAHHRVADLGHLARHVTVQIPPASITGEEQGHGAVLLAGRYFDHRHAQPAVFIAHQDFAQLVAQDLWVVNVVVADAGLRIRLIAYKSRARVIRVVVPGHQPVTVGGSFRNGQCAAGFFQLETHRYGLRLVVGLRGQPAPGQSGPRAYAADQGCRPLELL